MKAQAGRPWTPEEIDVVIAAYFTMLDWQTSGRTFRKAEMLRSIAPSLPVRSKASIERKFQNISAIVREFGVAPVTGYLGLDHYQGALREAVVGRLRTR
jgi:hypothetical protein